jgi:hypothetical protein
MAAQAPEQAQPGSGLALYAGMWDCAVVMFCRDRAAIGQAAFE